MSGTNKVVCHGCKRKINVSITKPKYWNKVIGGTSNNPEYPAFATAKISFHMRGLFKGKCNRSGKVFRIKGKYIVEDNSNYNYFEWYTH